MDEITQEQAQLLLATLQRIAAYQSVPSLLRYASRDYGCSPQEAIEMAYENVIHEAKAAIKSHKSHRRKKAKPHD